VTQAGQFCLTAAKRITTLATAGEIPRFRGTGDSATGGRGIAGWVATEIRPGESSLAQAIGQATAASLLDRISRASLMPQKTESSRTYRCGLTVKGGRPLHAEPKRRKGSSKQIRYKLP